MQKQLPARQNSRAGRFSTTSFHVPAAKLFFLPAIAPILLRLFSSPAPPGKKASAYRSHPPPQSYSF